MSLFCFLFLLYFFLKRLKVSQILTMSITRQQIGTQNYDNIYNNMTSVTCLCLFVCLVQVGVASVVAGVAEVTGGVAQVAGGVGGSVADDGGVVDEGGGGAEDGGVAGQHGGVSLTLLTLAGLGGGNSGQVGGLGLGNLGGVLHGLRGHAGVDGRHQGLGVEGGGHQGLGVELRGDTVVDGGNGQTGVHGAETGTIGNIGDGLQLAVGVNVAVATGHTAVGVSNLVLHAVEVGITVVEVAEL